MRKNINSVKVFSPASVANVGPGFDILGFAINNIGDTITLTKRNDESYVIEAIGAELPLNPDQNVATVALKSFCNHVGHKGGFDIKIEKNFTPGSGLGSSASSAVGAVYAANELLELGFSREELITFALDGEALASGNRHGDNVVPCMLGGFVGVKNCDPYEGFQVSFPDDLNVLIVFPDVPIKTSEARAILPQTITLKDGIKQAANMAGLIKGLMDGDYSLIKASLQDVFAQPHRKKMIPQYDRVEDIIMKKGAIGFNISGSGPAMFAFFNKNQGLTEVKRQIESVYNAEQIHVQFLESTINKNGVTIV